MQLEAYCRTSRKNAVTALDEVLADYLEAEQQDYDDTVKAARVAYEDVKAGRTQLAEEFLEELRVKHGFPR